MNSAQPPLSERPSPLTIDAVALLAAIALFGWDAWVTRFALMPDGMSYLEIAQAYLRGAWSDAVNPFWSPLYSWILAVFLAVLRPTPYWELPLMALSHLAIAVAALFSIRFLVNELIAFRATHRRPDRGIAFSDAMLRVVAYSSFLFVSYTILRRDTQDLLMSCFLFLALGLLLRIIQAKAATEIALGITCGLGYLAKSIFWPLSLVFLLCAALARRPLRTAWRPLLVAGAAFAAVSSPFAVWLSSSTGKWTFGEAGRINFHRFVDDSGHKWNRVERLKGGVFTAPRHHLAMGRKIYDNPEVWEFATASKATYPLHYNPARWNYHTEPHVAPGTIFRSCCDNLLRIAELLARCAPLAILALVLLLKTRWRQKSRREIGGILLLLIPPLAGIAAYLPILVELRYVAHFFIALLLVAFTVAELGGSRADSRLLTLLSPAALASAAIAAMIFGFVQHQRAQPHVSWHIATQLHDMAGLSAGDRVCILGRGSYQQNWAKAAGVQIAAEILNADNFLNAPEEKRREIHRLLRERGIVAMIDTTGATRSAGFQPLAAAPMSVQSLDQCRELACRNPRPLEKSAGEKARRH